jgi:hypothetical protein
VPRRFVSDSTFENARRLPRLAFRGETEGNKGSRQIISKAQVLGVASCRGRLLHVRVAGDAKEICRDQVVEVSPAGLRSQGAVQARMTTRVEAEVDLVRSEYPALQFRPEDGWALVPGYPLPQRTWRIAEADVAFQFPQLAGQPPYGFWVRPGLTLVDGGAPQNYAFPVTTPFGPDFGQFSWSPEEWRPSASVSLGSNMLRWVNSFSLRLAEGA